MTGFVYLIGSEQFGWYKIGKAKSADVRLDQLGILLPFKVEVFAIWEADNHSELKKIAHRIHSDNRINGEWFGFSVTERQQVIQRVSKWDARLVFPNGMLLAKQIRTSNVKKNIVIPMDGERTYKHKQKSAAFEAYVLAHGVDRMNKEAVHSAWEVVLANIRAEKKALSA